MFIVSALSNMGTKIRRLAIQKCNHFASFLCTVLLKCAKIQLSPQTRKYHRFACFCNCDCKTSTICHKWTRFFNINNFGTRN